MLEVNRARVAQPQALTVVALQEYPAAEHGRDLVVVRRTFEQLLELYLHDL